MMNLKKIFYNLGLSLQSYEVIFGLSNEALPHDYLSGWAVGVVEDVEDGGGDINCPDWW